ncbi:MAG: ferrous iron transport protein B [Candidatus Cloacimonadota bacterium]|nr:MAG: ferrous iron transport protein B [Candidatus Cloacimonadota bacterium]PIE78819.1 MAG: ferrous iron transport protein B [Candidatus Delongbacteria bacterium]
MKLSELVSGDKGQICKVKGTGAFRKRILEMGFVTGKDVEVIKNAPLQDPIEYKIMGYNISLRRSEADLIEVTKDGLDTHINGFSGVINEGGLKKSFNKDGSKTINVALVGNPNCGKTTLFNHASNSKERVGNYGGVTVDTKEASVKKSGYNIKISDLPGTYSLTEYSPEELYVRKHIFDTTPDIIINVVDASNLERNLYLTTQLIDMDVKVIVALNMFDEMEKRRDKFDSEKLGKMIGIPFVPIVSTKGKGIDKLFEKVIEVFNDEDESIRHIHINYGDNIEESIKRIQKHIRTDNNTSLHSRISPRFLSVKLLEGDSVTEELIKKEYSSHQIILSTVNEELKKLESIYNDDAETVITDSKYGFISGALKETLTPGAQERRDKTKMIDNFVTHKLLGFPIFLFFMWLMFQATFTLGDPFMGWIEDGVGLLSEFVAGMLSDGMLKDLIIDGIIGGVGGVIVFLPNILILFLFISFLEDSGYMARAVFIIDKLMHKIGLHGKSFIPLIMGFGCNVPAVMATRTIKSRNNRMITMLINPFMSCGARLPVYILLIGTFFPENSGSMLFFIYGFGILVAILTALFFKKTFFKGEELPFVMELPPYRMPTIKSTIMHMWDKGSQYLKKMGGVILVASIIIWALGYFPKDIDYSKNYDETIALIQKYYNSKIESSSSELKKKYETEKQEKVAEQEILKESERQEKSYIGQIGKFIEPVIRPLGFDWKVGVALVTGLAAKEVVVSTMGVLYQADLEADEENESLRTKLQAQLYPPEYKNSGEKKFSSLIAFSLMIFVLLYVPCIAVIAAINREAGEMKWAIFSAVYTTGLAYILSLIIYQVGRVIL